jgi:hypothetical protein
MSTISIEVGPELFRFESKQQWVSNACEWFAERAVSPHDYICVDARGRVVRLGAHFARAERDGAYPVVVYLLEQPAEARR